MTNLNKLSLTYDLLIASPVLNSSAIMSSLPLQYSVIQQLIDNCIFYAQNLDEAIQWNNEVPQGLSSSIFTRDVSNVFKWLG